ncbi:vWA domain-containing protein [Candidatus Methylacidithermus pantelleriae]|uniref:Putative VWFA domain-containing protein n=1 Tax=Candidatus Methylacidithermus pantelleriae TaxID=2744239 RepID=A0A8J2BJ49_9BACT|nr:VWA domain-containing protein [Candidatus Methylacidithermus pantelleriae]CAF0689027.1 putative VWFA domain-containing protein [Candidatus Methylacidithermus pantelleriae]
MSFGSPSFLWLLLAWTGFCLWFFLQRKTFSPFAQQPLCRVEIFPRQNRVIGIRNKTQVPLFLWLGVFFLLLALARPQWGKVAFSLPPGSSRKVLLVLDLSQSMLCTDVHPSRLGRAKVLVEGMLARLKGEEVGLVIFSGTAFEEVPFTRDYEVLRQTLAELDPSYLPVPGTRFRPMLETVLRVAERSKGEPIEVFLLSDGEAHDQSWSSYLGPLRKAPVRIWSIGIGTSSGSVIPAGKGLLHDSFGKVVVSRLEPRSLEELAQATGGGYLAGDRWVDLASLLEQLEGGRVPEGFSSGVTSERRQEHFALFLAIAFVLLCLSLWREIPASPPGSFQLPGGVLRKWGLSLALILGLASFSLSRQAWGAFLQTIEELSERDRLSGREYERLASDTLVHAQRELGLGHRVPRGIVLDALEAVDRGERSSPKLAPWKELRDRLNELLRELDKRENLGEPSFSPGRKKGGSSSSSSSTGRERAGESCQGESESRSDSNEGNGSFSFQQNSPPVPSGVAPQEQAGGQSSRSSISGEKDPLRIDQLSEIEEGDSQARILGRLRRSEATFSSKIDKPW